MTFDDEISRGKFQPVILLGAPRSGTQMYCDMICGHPEMPVYGKQTRGKIRVLKNLPFGLGELAFADPMGKFSVYGLFVFFLNLAFVVAVSLILGIPCLIAGVAIALTSPGGVFSIRYAVFATRLGITSCGQVSGVAISEPKRLAIHDHRYAALRAILLDVKIVLKTVLGGAFGDPVGGDHSSASQNVAAGESSPSIPNESVDSTGVQS